MICVEIHSNNVLTVRDDILSNAVSDSVKHETVKFLFSDNWRDYQKTAVFSAEGVDPINVLLDEDSNLCLSSDECYIPFEVLTGDSFYLSVFGVKGDSLATTTKIKIRVFESGYALGDKPSEPTESEYSQIMGIATLARAIAQSVRDDADNGLFKGEKGDKGENGERGESGVYVGSGDMPEGCNLQIDPIGETLDIPSEEWVRSIVADEIANLGATTLPDGDEVSY